LRRPLQLHSSTLKNSIFDFASGSRLKNFSLIFPNEISPFHSLSKEKTKILLTPSAPSPSLSPAMKPAFKKLASILFVAMAYAVTSYAFFLIFFKSQF
jgi:hypothetical protein